MLESSAGVNVGGMRPCTGEGSGPSKASVAYAEGSGNQDGGSEDDTSVRKTIMLWVHHQKRSCTQ